MQKQLFNRKSYFFFQKLTSIRIPYNNLTKVPRLLLSSSLLGLNLRGNPIHLIKADDFQTCPNLTHLTLSWASKFDKIPLTIIKGAFDNLNKLKILDLAGNMLRTLSYFSMHSKPHFLGLGLAFNCLKMSVHDPADISSASLIELQISGNTFCNSKTYPSKPRIHRLLLKENFVKLTKLESLEYGAITKVKTPNLLATIVLGFVIRISIRYC